MPFYWCTGEIPYLERLERFAALVEAHVNAKEKERQLFDIHSCGPDCDRYICVAVRKAREEEREACAKVCESAGLDSGPVYCAFAIRERK